MCASNDFFETKDMIAESISNQQSFDNYNYEKYSKVYPFATEPIKSYYKKFDYSSDILSVASSGDILLHAYLMGANNVTLFDVNKLTNYYIALKIAGIKNLSFEDFYKYFVSETIDGYPTLEYEIFKKFEKSLDKESRKYWNLIYEKYRMNDKIFQKGFFYLDGDYRNCDYINPRKYIFLQELLKSKEPYTFINKDILLFDEELNDKMYSSIFLSNIIDYAGDDDYFKEFMEKKLSEHLLPDSKIMYNYSTNEEKYTFRGKQYRKQRLNDKDKIYVYIKK